jgi:hypothetical protein
VTANAAAASSVSSVVPASVNVGLASTGIDPLTDCRGCRACARGGALTIDLVPTCINWRIDGMRRHAPSTSDHSPERR